MDEAQRQRLAERAIKSRQQLAEVSHRERARMVEAGMDPEEIRARIDCLMVGIGVMVDGRCIDPLRVKFFVRGTGPDGEVAPGVVEMPYTLTVGQDGSTSVRVDFEPEGLRRGR